MPDDPYPPVEGGLTTDEAVRLPPGTIVELLVKRYPEHYTFRADPGDQAEITAVTSGGLLQVRWLRVELKHDWGTFYPGSFRVVGAGFGTGHAAALARLFGVE